MVNRPGLNYLGGDWALLEEWLEEEQLLTYKRLANPKASEMDTQQLRGRAMLIAQILGFKEQIAAEQAAQRE